jgi:hypothetical protein
MQLKLSDVLPDEETIRFKHVGVPLLECNYEYVND